jgi:hypothetical protein
VEINFRPDQSHARVSFLAQCLSGTLMDDAPFPVPSKTFWPHFPICVKWDIKATTALDGIDGQTFHDKLTTCSGVLDVFS